MKRSTLGCSDRSSLCVSRGAAVCCPCFYETILVVVFVVYHSYRRGESLSLSYLPYFAVAQ